MDIATEEELDKIVVEAEEGVKESRRKGWESFQAPIKIERDALVKIINDRSCKCTDKAKENSVDSYTEELKQVASPIRKDNFVTARKILRNVCATCLKADNLNEELHGWLKRNYAEALKGYDAYLYNDTPTSVLN